MAREVLKAFARPVALAKALRKMILGGVMAATAALPSTSSANVPLKEPAPAVPSVTPTIVNRSKKAAKLILQLPGSVASLATAHRSHSSHRSHMSHYSSSGGSTYTPPPATTKPVEPVTTTDATAVTGEIVSIDKVKRTFVVKETPTVRKTFSYRDDTKHVSHLGVSLRFDETTGSSGLPISVGDQVQVSWRVSSDGLTTIATNVRQTTPKRPRP
jgi:hypothetical protein